jgi:hypothetical protein
MLFFLTSHDAETVACAAVGREVAAAHIGAIGLHGYEATHALLQAHLVSQPQLACFFMSHGTNEAIYGNDEMPAIGVGDFQNLPGRHAFAYACFSAMLGQQASTQKWTWWGYDNRIIPPPEEASAKAVPIFAWIARSFDTVTSQADVDKLLDDLKNVCDQALDATDPLELLTFFMQLWTRVRVWLPGAKAPLKHPDAFAGALDGMY